MDVVVAIPAVAIAAFVLTAWLMFALWRRRKRRAKLDRLRARQEAERLKALERGLAPPRRNGLPWRK